MQMAQHEYRPRSRTGSVATLRGGGGAFGVVTAFELWLHSQPTVSAGTLFFPMPRAGGVLHAWRRWTRTVSNRTMSCGRLLQLPPLHEVPHHLRGRAFVAVEVAHQGNLASSTHRSPRCETSVQSSTHHHRKPDGPTVGQPGKLPLQAERNGHKLR
jgi:hypothetical protein